MKCKPVRDISLHLNKECLFKQTPRPDCRLFIRIVIKIIWQRDAFYTGLTSERCVFSFCMFKWGSFIFRCKVIWIWHLAYDDTPSNLVTDRQERSKLQHNRGYNSGVKWREASTAVLVSDVENDIKHLIPCISMLWPYAVVSVEQYQQWFTGFSGRQTGYGETGSHPRALHIINMKNSMWEDLSTGTLNSMMWEVQ